MNKNRGLFHRAIVTLGLTAPTVLLVAASLPRVHAQPPANLEGKTAEKAFKNIKVLKDLPANKLIPTMHAWNTSLGVQCDFCHEIGPNHSGFERDVKPTKNMARKMVIMAIDLNKHQKLLDGKATCYLCHHGHAAPETHGADEGPQRR